MGRYIEAPGVDPRTGDLGVQGWRRSSSRLKRVILEATPEQWALRSSPLLLRLFMVVSFRSFIVSNICEINVNKPTEGIRSRFKELIEQVSVEERPDFLSNVRSFHSSPTSGASLYLDDRDERALNHIVSHLAGNARRGGWNRKLIRNKVLDGVIQIIQEDSSVKEVLDYLDVYLSSPLQNWRVFAHLPASLPRPFKVGGCILHKSKDSWFHESPPPEEVWDNHEPPVVETYVQAQDAQSAQLTALLPLDEVAACLSIIRSPISPRLNASTVLDDSRVLTSVYYNQAFLIVWDTDVTSEGELIYPWSTFSTLLAESQASRSQAGQRLIGACRWYLRAVESLWLEGKAVHAFSALDTLLLPEAANVTASLSRAISHSISIEGWSASDIETWVQRAYRSRSGSTHAGDPVLEESDVELLLGITRTLLRRAAGILAERGRMDLKDLSSRLQQD